MKNKEFETKVNKYSDLVSKEKKNEEKDFLALRGILKGFNYDKKEAREEMIHQRFSI